MTTPETRAEAVRCPTCGSGRKAARHSSWTDRTEDGGRIVYYDTEPFDFGGYCASKACADAWHETALTLPADAPDASPAGEASREAVDAAAAYHGNGDPGHVETLRLARALDAFRAPALAEVERLKAIIERDRSAVAKCVGLLNGVVRGYGWAVESRGPYRNDDDEYRREFGRALQAVEGAMEPLVGIGRDLRDSPCTTEDARAALVPPLFDPARIDAALRGKED